MKVVILAGGLGSRLKPFTDIIPKPLIPISGERSVLEIQISNLKKHGFTDIIIATSYKSNLIESYLGNGERYGVDLTFSKEKKPLGTCGPVTLLKDQLLEPFILMNGDILTNLNFKHFYDVAVQNNSIITVVTKEIIAPFSFGNVQIKDNLIEHIEEKPTLKLNIVAGIYFLRPRIFDYIPENKYYGIDHLIKTFLENNISVASYLTSEYWVDIGRLDDLNEAREKFRENNHEQ